MTRQNKLHKYICQWEKEHKVLMKNIQRAYPRGNRSRKNRKFFRQLDKDFLKMWKKEQS